MYLLFLECFEHSHGEALAVKQHRLKEHNWTKNNGTLAKPQQFNAFIFFTTPFLAFITLSCDGGFRLCQLEDEEEEKQQRGSRAAVAAAWCVSLGFGGRVQAGGHRARFVRQLRGFYKLTAVH